MELATLNEIEKLKQQIKYYEDEQKHPIKHNRQLQKRIKELEREIYELNQKQTPVDDEDIIPAEEFVCENPLALETFYGSFRKPNTLKKH